MRIKVSRCHVTDIEGRKHRHDGGFSPRLSRVLPEKVENICERDRPNSGIARSLAGALRG
jgi:hypothetical protein